MTFLTSTTEDAKALKAIGWDATHDLDRVAVTAPYDPVIVVVTGWRRGTLEQVVWVVAELKRAGHEPRLWFLPSTAAAWVQDAIEYGSAALGAAYIPQPTDVPTFSPEPLWALSEVAQYRADGILGTPEVRTIKVPLIRLARFQFWGNRKAWTYYTGRARKTFRCQRHSITAIARVLKYPAREPRGRRRLGPAQVAALVADPRPSRFLVEEFGCSKRTLDRIRAEFQLKPKRGKKRTRRQAR